MIKVERTGSEDAGKWDNGGWFADIHIWIDRPSWWRVPRCILRAAPTCTLWEPCIHMDAVQFRFFKRWRITSLQMIDAA